MIVQRRYCRCGDIEFMQRATTGIWVCRHCGLMTKPYAMGRNQQFADHSAEARQASAIVSPNWTADLSGD